MSMCRNYSRQITAYLEGELPPADARTVEGHLAECGACARAAANERILRDALRRLVLPAPPAESYVRIRAALEPATPLPGPRARRAFHPAWLVAAALLVAVWSASLRLFAPPRVLEDALTAYREIDAGRTATESFPSAEDAARILSERTRRAIALPQWPGRTGAVSIATDIGAACARYECASHPLLLYLVPAGELRLPAAAGRCVVYRDGDYSIMICAAGELAHVWVARTSPGELIEQVRRTPVGRELVEHGAVMQVRGIECAARGKRLRRLAESVAGVEAACVFPETGTLRVRCSPDFRMQDLHDTLASAGFLPR
jgi:hypothetical protein